MSPEKRRQVRESIKQKASDDVKRSNNYAKKYGSAVELSKGIININPDKQKNALGNYNGKTYVLK